jgi:DDE superfamily endonuclease
VIIVRQNLLDDVAHQIHHRGQIGEGDLWSIWEALANLPCCGPAPSTSLDMERLLYSFDLPGPLFSQLTVVADNAKIHHAHKVEQWLVAHPRFELLYLPRYCPRAKPIARLWRCPR